MASTSRWTLDYTPGPNENKSIPDPPGHPVSLSAKELKAARGNKAEVAVADLTPLRLQKAWDVALGPAKNIPMQAGMLWMSGNAVSIYSLMSLWFLVKNSFGALFTVNTTFAPYTPAPPPAVAGRPAKPADDSALLLPKLAFVACQIALLGVGAWKANSIGLLPTMEGDWLAFQSLPVWDQVSDASRWSRWGLPPLAGI